MTHEPTIRRTLMVVLGFNALSQIAGGIGLLTGAINPGLSLLQGTPFADYTMPGLILSVVAGGGSLAALALAWLADRTTGDIAGFISNPRRGYPRLSLQGGSAVSFHVVHGFVYRRACGNLRLWSGADTHGPNERVRPPQGIWTAVLGPGIP